MSDVLFQSVMEVTTGTGTCGLAEARCGKYATSGAS